MFPGIWSPGDYCICEIKYRHDIAQHYFKGLIYCNSIQHEYGFFLPPSSTLLFSFRLGLCKDNVTVPGWKKVVNLLLKPFKLYRKAAFKIDCWAVILFRNKYFFFLIHFCWEYYHNEVSVHLENALNWFLKVSIALFSF